MHVNRIIADLHVGDIEEAKSFYTDFLGLSTESFNMGWVARFTSPDAETVVQLVTGDKTAPAEPVLDVEGAFEEAKRRGYEIVHPLTTESWGVRRFFVRAPDGNLLNIVRHKNSPV
jgi:catechol 2,3-dioxygenase-like lactoylglutathione lyase family enzyme